MVRLALAVACLLAACGDDPPARERITIGGTADGGGEVVAASASAAAHAECTGGECVLDAGLGSVTLTATANTGHAFRGWSGDTCDGYAGSGEAITFDMPTTSHACVARFVQR